MAQKAFAGNHTQRKLDALRKYLVAFQNVMKYQPMHTIYFDGFAGTGEIPIAVGKGPTLLDAEPISPFVTGSAKLALSLDRPFDRYIFVESMSAKIGELHKLRASFTALEARINIQKSDANDALKSFCTDTDWNCNKAVIFLDPFGNQVNWESIELIANTTKADLWYLFPAGLGVNRQLGKGGKVRDDHAKSLDRIFGGRHWERAFLQPTGQGDLFSDSEDYRKVADAKLITEFMIQQMKGVFGGRVLDDWLPLGSRNIHMYSLLFAVANKDPKAWQRAEPIARAVLKRRR